MTAGITGRTRIFAILADPIGHVQTPQLLNRLMADRAFDGVMIPLHVTPGGLAACFEGLRQTRNFGGCVVTVPHKGSVPALCDEVSARAEQTGAANVVRREDDGRLVSDMLDGLGFVNALSAQKVRLADASVFIAGAGGAAAAIAFALADEGIARITIGNRTAGRGRRLADRLSHHHPSLTAVFGDDPAGHDLVINATSLGLRNGDALPLAIERVDSGALVAEIVMDPAVTPLIAAARARGLPVQMGSEMLSGQLESIARFLGMHNQKNGDG